MLLWMLWMVCFRSRYEGSLKLLPGSHIEIAQKTSLTGDTAEAPADDDAPKVQPLP